MSPTGVDAEALYQQAHQLREQAKLHEAEDAYDRVAALVPNAAGPHHWIGLVRLARGDPTGAERAFREALRREPNRPISLHGLGMALLGQGEYADGFPLLEARHRVQNGSPKPPLPFRRWSGEDVTGRSVLIWPEEGFGDQIQFARFAKQLPSRNVAATWYCSSELAPLFSVNLGIEVLRAEGSVALPHVDFWLLSSSLPALFPSDELPTTPYLAAKPRVSEKRVGIVTSGNPKQANDANRSLPPELAAELMALPESISLKPEDTGALSFLDTAEIIAGLDLVITVDSAVAHLSGAMGKPTWVLLPKIGTDWRWMVDQQTSPWYPSARLYRQETPGDWTGVLKRIKEDLTTR